jgi:hypothetical protein
LILKPIIKQLFTIQSWFLLDIGSRLVPDFNVVIQAPSRYDSTNPTIIVTPKSQVVSITENQKQLTTIIDASVGVIDSISSVVAIRDVYIENNLGLVSESTFSREYLIHTDFGACDVFSSDVDADKYEFAQLGNRFSLYENMKFNQDLGVAKYAGQHISAQNTLQEMEIYYPTITIGDFADRSESSLGANGAHWQVHWPTINEYGAILDQSLTSSATIVYVPTGVVDRFPSSGKLLIGGEVVSYTGVSNGDRFTGVTRGVNGTTAQPHTIGDYLRSLL